MNMKYIIALGALVILVGVGGYVAGKAQKSDKEPKWLTYTNEEYGYSVRYPNNAKVGQDAISLGFSSPEIGGANQGSSLRTFSTNYIEEGLPRKKEIGTIFCADTTHLFFSPLDNAMPLKEYAQTLFDLKAKGYAYSEENPLGVIPLITIPTETKETFAGKEAYYFTFAENGIGGGFDANMYVVIENHEGKKCIVEYPAFDFYSRQEPEILQTRARWFNSFQWIR